MRIIWRWLTFGSIAAIEIVLLALCTAALFAGDVRLTGNLAVLSSALEWALPRQWVWAALMLLPPLHWVLYCLMRRKESAVTIKTSSAERIRVYRTAIIQYIRNSVADIPQVQRSWVTIRQARGGTVDIGVQVKLDFKPGPGVGNVPAIQAQIERRVRERVRELLGIELVHKITVDVVQFGALQRTPAALPSPDFPLQSREESSEVTLNAEEKKPPRAVVATAMDVEESETAEEEEEKHFTLREPDTKPRPDTIEMIHGGGDDPEDRDEEKDPQSHPTF